MNYQNSGNSQAGNAEYAACAVNGLSQCLATTSRESVHQVRTDISVWCAATWWHEWQIVIVDWRVQTAALELNGKKETIQIMVDIQSWSKSSILNATPSINRAFRLTDDCIVSQKRWWWSLSFHKFCINRSVTRAMPSLLVNTNTLKTTWTTNKRNKNVAYCDG